ncbi:MAG TPA: TonB family protein [Steroidobacteraceae bacterium]|nr:TonB family protein [Steroidobacteraceae bacterium]
MKNPLLPSLLLVFTSLALAADQTIFATSDESPGAVDPGFQALPWADDADLQSPAEGTPLDRWTKQADAGRAKAAAILGRVWLERVAENPENCAKAIEWFTKADKLGSNEAPAWLGHLYRRFDCPQRDVKVAIDWLRKAVPLVSFGAAADLTNIYSDASAPEKDPLLAYAYARVAAESHEFADDDPATPGRVAALEQALDAGQERTATDLAYKLLADVSRRRALLTAAPREEKLKAATSGKGWTVSLVAFDELRECAANTAANCRGVRRSAYFDAVNKGAEYLRCNFELDHRDFALGTKITNARETLLPPKATRRLFAGRIGEVADSKDLRVTCTPLAGLAANIAAGKCKLTTTGVPSVADFYPPGAKRRNEQGRVVVNVWMDKKEGQPAVVELKQSSGFPELDVAGVKMGTYMAFKGDCDQGYTSVAIAFKLED